MEAVGRSVYVVINNEKVYVDAERAKIGLQNRPKRDQKKVNFPGNELNNQWHQANKTPIWSTARNKPQLLINQSATHLLLSYIKKYWKKTLKEENSGSRFWDKIAALLIVADYHLGEDPGARCHKKWMSLKRAYTRYEKEKHKKSAQELVLSKPPFYKEIQTIVEGQKRSETMNQKQICQVSESLPEDSPTTYYTCPSSSSEEEGPGSHGDPVKRLELMARRKRSLGRSSPIERFVELIVESTSITERYRAKKEQRLQLQIKGRNAARRRRHNEKMDAINKLTNALLALLPHRS